MEITDLRIWSTVRSPNEVQAGMFNFMDAGLEALPDATNIGRKYQQKRELGLISHLMLVHSLKDTVPLSTVAWVAPGGIVFTCASQTSLSSQSDAIVTHMPKMCNIRTRCGSCSKLDSGYLKELFSSLQCETKGQFVTHGAHCHVAGHDCAEAICMNYNWYGATCPATNHGLFSFVWENCNAKDDPDCSFLLFSFLLIAAVMATFFTTSFTALNVIALWRYCRRGNSTQNGSAPDTNVAGTVHVDMI